MKCSQTLSQINIKPHTKGLTTSAPIHWQMTTVFNKNDKDKGKQHEETKQTSEPVLNMTEILVLSDHEFKITNDRPSTLPMISLAVSSLPMSQRKHSSCQSSLFLFTYCIFFWSFLSTSISSLILITYSNMSSAFSITSLMNRDAKILHKC